MFVILLALCVYALGMVCTAVGSRLAGRCTTWCCALLGLPLWAVGGTVVPFCLALPQLTLAFQAAGLSLTSIAVGAALAGAVTNLGLALAVCLLRPQPATVHRGEFTRKCALLLAACAAVTLFVRGGKLSYTGNGILMALFVVFVLQSIVYQYNAAYNEAQEPISTDGAADAPAEGYTAGTMSFPAMGVFSSLKNLSGVVLGMVLLGIGAQALVYSAITFANMTGTIQALWASTLVSFGFCLPLLADVLDHPLGSVWKKFALKCRFFPADTLPTQLLNSAILNLTLALPVSGLMYRERLPIADQYRSYDIPLCAAMALVLLLPPLLRKRLYRWQGAVCLVLYGFYLAAVLLAPRAGA